MAGLIYKPVDGADIDFGKYAPGLESQVQGRWGRHVIPGQKGDLKEDLGEGSLLTRVKLQFVGATYPDYFTVVPALSKSRRGTLLHLLRGSRQVVITSLREEMLWTERGESVLVDVDLEDAIIGQADSFRAGPSARAQTVVSQSRTADAAMTTLQTKIFDRTDLQARVFVLQAAAAVSATTAAARTYAAAAQESFSLGLYGPSVQAQLRALPLSVQSSLAALRRVGPAADIQETVLALEVMLFSAMQLDVAIRAAQPIPIETKVTRQPGQSVYAFVQQHYGKSGKTPAEMRNLVSLILRLNKQIRRPSLIPSGTLVVRPVS
jgi:hypothetical protein